MAAAKQCDRCSCFYSSNRNNIYPPFKIIKKYDDYNSYHNTDLCPKCVTKLQEWCENELKED